MNPDAKKIEIIARANSAIDLAISEMADELHKGDAVYDDVIIRALATGIVYSALENRVHS